MLELFSQEEEPFIPHLPDGELHYYPAFLSSSEADKLFQHFYNETNWQADKITVFGKTYDQPRLTALYAKNPTPTLILTSPCILLQ